MVKIFVFFLLCIQVLFSQEQDKKIPGKFYKIKYFSNIWKKSHYRRVNELKSPFDKLVIVHGHLKSKKYLFDVVLKLKSPQTFSRYIKYDALKPISLQHIVYTQVIGKGFSPEQKKLVKIARDFIKIYFQLPLINLASIDPKLPKSATRINSGKQQVWGRYILRNILQHKRKKFKKTAALLAFTPWDIYAWKDNNAVLGLSASAYKKAVSSLYRFNKKRKKNSKYSGYKLHLIRTLNTTVHELGHVFHLNHCFSFPCLMNVGRDRRPLWLCPVCLQNLQWYLGFDVIKRYQEICVFLEKHQLKKLSNFYRESLRVLQVPKKIPDRPKKWPLALWKICWKNGKLDTDNDLFIELSDEQIEECLKEYQIWRIWKKN